MNYQKTWLVMYFLVIKCKNVTMLFPSYYCAVKKVKCIPGLDFTFSMSETKCMLLQIYYL